MAFMHVGVTGDIMAGCCYSYESLNGQSLVSCPLLHVELRWSELACQMYSLEQLSVHLPHLLQSMHHGKNVARAL